jgi:hypothetical protein
MELTRLEIAKNIWPQLQNAKFKEFYVELLLEKYQKLERGINIFLVIITSSSVSAWAIFKIEWLQWVWAGLVCVSQIVILIRPYLNYSKYIKELNEKYYRLQAINLTYLQFWNNIKYEKVTPEEANKKQYELLLSLSEALKFSDGLIMPEKKEFCEEAKGKVESYLKLSMNYLN